MPTLLRHLLFLGLLLGLAGNGVAAPACGMMPPHRAAAMADMPDMPDCEGAMSRPDRGSNTDGKGMKHGCMMLAGCSVALALREPALAAASPGRESVIAFWPVTAVLAGRIVPPEPEPPAFPG